MRNFIRVFNSAIVSVFVFLSVNAHATDIGAPSTGFFSQIGGWLLDLVDFVEGPWGLFVSIVGLSIAVGLWMFSTRGNEQLGGIAKVVVGVLLIVNIPALVIALQGF